MNELHRKSLINSIAAWLTVPLALVWLISNNAKENLAVSYPWAFLIVAGVIVYCSLRLLAVYKVKKYLQLFNFLFLFFDLVIVSFVIVISGGQQSVFFNLFWATVISASIYFGIRGAVGASIAVFVFYPSSSFIANKLFAVNFKLEAAIFQMYPFTLIAVMLGFLVREERRQRLEKEKTESLLIEADLERNQLKDALYKKTLTNREKEVLLLLKDGLNNEQIAKQLFISNSTVKKHVRNILVKLDVKNRTQAAVIAERQYIKD